MLEVASKYGFEPQQTEKNAKKYFNKMMEQEVIFANQSAEIEYIPYDQLWYFALEILKTQSNVHS